MIIGCITTLAIGIICIVIGITNMRGNISSLHSYHRHRVAPEDVPAFGKAVGAGTVTVGASVSLLCPFLILAEKLENQLLITAGTVLLIIGVAIGIFISLRAIVKYNKGLF